jgi:APA family basic amino acid/polyamine antiporter
MSPATKNLPSSDALASGGAPRPTLGPLQAVAIVVGIVIGAGIFKAPSLVAMNSPSEAWMMAAWVLGGVISIIGALCYCELATAYPSAGGDYHFLHRAFGRQVSFLFAWSRFAVITTGSIALLAFVFGDYMTKVLPLGEHSTAVWAVGSVLVLTWVNIRGIRQGAAAQVLLTWLEVGGLILVFVAGVVAAVGGLGASAPEAVAAAAAAKAAATSGPSASAAFSWGAFGFAMVFVLLTFGGWNEGAYISAELRDRERNMVKVMVGSLVVVTLLYLAANWAYLAALGLKGMGSSKAVAADLMGITFGKTGEVLISIMVAVAALTSINATMMVGARSNFAAGRDWDALGKLGVWVEDRGTPANALWAQGVFAIVLIGLGLATGGGFATLVEYTAPVFWLFFLLSGLSLFVLRWREPATPRPFKVPLYPVLPVLFCLSCAYMLNSSLGYVGSNAFLGVNAAWVGVGVLAVGLILLIVVAALGRRR